MALTGRNIYQLFSDLGGGSGQEDGLPQAAEGQTARHEESREREAAGGR